MNEVEPMARSEVATAPDLSSSDFMHSVVQKFSGLLRHLPPKYRKISESGGQRAYQLMPSQGMKKCRQKVANGLNKALTLPMKEMDQQAQFMLSAALERTESFRSSRGAPSHSGTNAHRPKRTTSTQAMSAENSPTREASSRLRGSRHMKDFISIREKLTNRGRGGSSPVENDNGRRRTSSSRGPTGIPPLSKSITYSRPESPDKMLPKSLHRMRENSAVPSSPEKDNPDPDTHAPPTQVQTRASSRNIDRRPSTADRKVEKDKHQNTGDVKQKAHRSSLTIDRKSTTAAIPLSQPLAPTASSSSGTRRTEKSQSRSSSTASRQAEIRSSREGDNGSMPRLKQAAAKLISPSSRTSNRKPSSKPSSNDGFADFEFNAGNDNPTTKSNSLEVGQEKELAESATKSYAWHESANGFTTEMAAADDGRLYVRKRSSGGKLRHKYAPDRLTVSRRIYPNEMFDSKEDNGAHFPSDGHASHESLKQEDQAESARKYRRQGSAGGNLKRENAASGAYSREGMINNETSSDLEKYRSSTFLQRNDRNVRWLLKGVAAASYNYGGWVPYDEMVPYPDDIAMLNKFLNDCRSEVEAGVPGRFLTVVLGHENSDLDSIMSTLTYAYFLSSIGDNEERKIFVPVINMRQEDLPLHTEAVWLFKVAGVDTSKLLFVDQISLQYYHRFGNLKLVLVDHSRLAPHQETLQDAVIEIVDHNLIDDLYSWVPVKDIQQVGSCCTIVTERYVTEAPELLAGRGVNRLLLGPILLDTANLDFKSTRCTARDQCMAAFLINGAGRYGRHGFFRLLKKMQFDISALRTVEILRKDFKQWRMGPGKTDTNGLKGRVVSAAMSTLGVPLKEIMLRKGILEDLRFFGRKMKLDLHVIVTAYYDNTDHYKREILIVPRDTELKEHVRSSFRPHKSDLQLSYILIPGLPDDMLVYKQGLVTASRIILRKILKDYFET